MEKIGLGLLRAGKAWKEYNLEKNAKNRLDRTTQPEVLEEGWVVDKL